MHVAIAIVTVVMVIVDCLVCLVLTGQIGINKGQIICCRYKFRYSYCLVLTKHPVSMFLCLLFLWLFLMYTNVNKQFTDLVLQIILENFLHTELWIICMS